MFTPSTNLRLLNVPFSSDGLDTIYFGSLAEQQEYFNSKVKVNCGNEFNYIKKDRYIVVDGNPEQLFMVNYVMYMNENYSNKWFYAFVTHMEWASNNSTRLYIRTDPIQTWLFELNLYESFIVRQHSESDNVGDNIQPEPFSVSRTKYQRAGYIDFTPDWIQIYATCTKDGSSVNGGFNGGIYSGAAQIFFDSVSPNNTLSDYVANGVADGVCRIQQAASLGDSAGPPVSKTFAYQRHPDNVCGYVPKNKKLLSGAFCHGFVSGGGHNFEFVPEFCNGDNCNLKVLQDYTSGSLYFYLANYGLVDGGVDNVMLGFSIVIPESSWAYNKYKNDYNLHSTSNSQMVDRLTNRRNYNMARNAAVAGASAADIAASYIPTVGDGSIANDVINMMDSANAIGETVMGYDEITQELTAIGEDYNAPATGNLATSNPFVAAKECKVMYGWIVPDSRFAKSYDDFLTVYGYAQNKYAVPNLHARKAFTYIKVSELHAGGELPDSDMMLIKSLFAKGLYFWAVDATIGDFSQDNSVL